MIDLKFTYNKNLVIVLGGVFYVAGETYNQISTTGLIDAGGIIKSLLILWFSVQSLVAHHYTPDGAKTKEVCVVEPELNKEKEKEKEPSDE